MKLSVLDQSPVPAGIDAGAALANSIDLARNADRLGYHRYWVAEHHNMDGLAGSSPEVLIARLAAETERLRVGSGGVMLTHYSSLKVAESFRVLHALYPGRIDLGLGRAPGSDPLTAAALASSPAPNKPLIAGSPTRVVPRVRELADRYGVDEVVVVTICHDHDARVRSYELLAEAFA